MSNDHVHPLFQQILADGLKAIDRLTPEQLSQIQLDEEE